MEKIYDLSEVAQELGFTRQGLYYWIKKGHNVPKRDYERHPVFTYVDLKRSKSKKIN